MDPYAGGMLSESPYAQKRPITGRVVALLKVEMRNRGLELIKPISRAVKTHEIHELILTAEKNAEPGSVVNDVSYVAFVEIETGGVLVVGDEVRIGMRTIGNLAGFNDTHMPNHQNILVRSERAATGVQMGIELEEKVTFGYSVKEKKE